MIRLNEWATRERGFPDPLLPTPAHVRARAYDLRGKRITRLLTAGDACKAHDRISKL
jgi:hypothetical protein